MDRLITIGRPQSRALITISKVYIHTDSGGGMDPEAGEGDGPQLNGLGVETIDGLSGDWKGSRLSGFDVWLLVIT